MRVDFHWNHAARAAASPRCRQLAAGLVSLALTIGGATAAERRAAMVIDANTGAVLHDRAGDAARYPASLTKMMTLYVAFDLIEQGKLSYQTRIKVSENAAGAEPTKLGLEVGRDIALIDAMKSLVTKSANDMAIAIAEHVAGSEEQFAKLMTAKARAIGMTSSTFANASGLPDNRQVTTAHDMLILAMRLQDDHPRHYPLFALKAFTYGGETMRNHNTMLHNIDGVDGIKTGYTRASGFNLVTSYRKGQKHLVAAVFGGTSAAARNAEMRTILTLALARASVVRTRRAGPVLVARNGNGAPAEPSWRSQIKVIDQAMRPKLAEAPQVVARSKPVEARRSVPQPTAVAAATPPAVRLATIAEATPDLPAARSSHIDVARVRPVSIVPVQAAPAVAPSMPEPAADMIPPPPIRQAQPAASPPRFAAASMAGNAARGAQPSTFQQQADAIGRGEAPVTPRQVAAAAPQPSATAYRLRGPDQATTGGVQIQIGAYSSETEALRQLEVTRGKAGGVLDPYAPLTVPVQSNGRQIYRARYAGFDGGKAASVCSELRRLQIDCLVTRD